MAPQSRRSRGEGEGGVLEYQMGRTTVIGLMGACLQSIEDGSR
jgi:hypothetical protein